MDFHSHQQFTIAATEVTSSYPMLVGGSYQATTVPDPISSTSYAPLSIPIFTAPFTSSGMAIDIPRSSGTTSNEAHFDYDEQVPEDLEDSEDDSSAAFLSNGLASSSSTGSTSDSAEFSYNYDGLLMPRRSNRDRRLPTPFTIPLPKESRTYWIKATPSDLSPCFTSEDGSEKLMR